MNSELRDARLLIKLRWAMVVAQLIVVLAVDWLLQVDAMRPAVWASLGVGALTNAGLWVLMRRFALAGRVASGAVLSIDIILLTLLLHLSGGPLNPFTMLYVLPLTIATITLTTPWSIGLTVLTLTSYGVLFHPSLWSATHHHHHGGDVLRLHLEGMWVAFAIAATFMVGFVWQIRRVLTAREAELEQVRRQRAREERLASLATLAAGAAHELSTPLSTIAVVGKEVTYALESMEGVDQTLIEDARVIRSEVDRCRRILEQMAHDAGSTRGESMDSVSLGTLAGELMGGMEDVEASPDALEAHVLLPRRAFALAMRGLLQNARDAARSRGLPVSVKLRVGLEDEAWSMTLEDASGGFDAELDPERLGEPFYTTKPPGQGMGLGVFLAQSMIERLGGRLKLEPGAQGVRVTWRVPREAMA